MQKRYQATMVADALAARAGTFVIRNAVKADARGVQLNAWVSVTDGVIDAVARAMLTLKPASPISAAGTRSPRSMPAACS